MGNPPFVGAMWSKGTQREDIELVFPESPKTGQIDYVAGWYAKAAKQGHDVAQWMLGRCYHNGRGVEQNYEEANKWFYLSAKQGNCYAQNSLGYALEHGLGIEQSYEEALEWYRKAAEKGLPSAYESIGYFYEKGLGVKRNIKEAEKWYNLSDNQNKRN